LEGADRLIVLSDLAAEVYARAGLAPHRLTVWPNFLRADLDPGPRSDIQERNGFLSVGRFYPEKAVDRVAAAWPADGPTLRIVGEGPEEPRIRAAAAGKPIEILGRVSRERVVELMRSSVGLVFPSAWYEGFPLVYAEAMAAGLPVLAWSPNVVARWVATDDTGMATTWDEDLRETLAAAAAAFPARRSRCRGVFEDRYSEAAYVTRAEALYAELSPGSA
jgi:glycosyltransferase involved in cell wall biosynthesis